MLRKYIKKEQFMLLSLSLIVLLIIWPYGKVYGSEIDWFSQHQIFPDYFRELFYKDHTLFPSLALSYGGGQNSAQLAYYGWMRPDILISYLFPFIKMSDVMQIAGIAYVIISTQLMYKWLMHHFPKKLALFASILFLLSAPLFFHSHRHIMFISYFPSLLIALIGCDAWMKNASWKCLVIGVFLMVLSSYYYSVGGICALFLYVLCHPCIYKQKMKAIISDMLRFTKWIGLALLLTSFFLLPVALSTLLEPREALETVNIGSLFSINKGLSALYYDSYNLGLSAIAGVSIVYFILKRKSYFWLSVSLLLILIVPFFQYTLNGMQYIREKSLLPFLPIVIYVITAFIKDVYQHKKNPAFIWAVLISATQLFLFTTVNMRVFFFVDLLVLSVIVMMKEKKVQYMFIYLLLPFCICIKVNMEEQYISKKDLQQEPKKELLKTVLNTDKSLYRLDDMSGNQYANSIADVQMWRSSIYSSNSNNTYNKFYYEVLKAPASSSNHVIVPSSYHPVLQNMMSVKYVFSRQKDLPKTYHILFQSGEYCIAENPNALPVAYITEDTISINDFEKLAYPYTLEALSKHSVVSTAPSRKEPSSIQPIPISFVAANHAETFSINKSDNGYIVKADKKSKLKVKLHENVDQKYVIIQFKIKAIKENDKVSIKIGNITNIKGAKDEIYSADDDIFTFVLEGGKEGVYDMTFSKGDYSLENVKGWIMDSSVMNRKNIQSIPLKNTNNKDIVSSEVDLKKDGYFITSFPYQKGFKILVDNKETPIEKVNTAFIGAKIASGKHSIKVIYEQPGLKSGIWLSFITLLFLLICIRYKKYRKGNSKKEGVVL